MTADNRKMNLLVTAADSAFVETAKRFFTAAWQNAAWPGDLMLLSHGIPEADLTWFIDRGVIIKSFPPLAATLPQRWPPVILDKLNLFRTEFRQWDNIAYLDCDMLIRSKLDGLAEVTRFAGLNTDLFFRRTRLENYFDKSAASFDQELYDSISRRYDLSAAGFSGGIFAFPASAIGQDTFSEITGLLPLISFAFWPDEIILNLVFHKRWQRLSSLYGINPATIWQRCGIAPEKQRALVFHVGQMQISRLAELGANPIDTISRISASTELSRNQIKPYALYLFMRYALHQPIYLAKRLLGLAGSAVKRRNRLSPSGKNYADENQKSNRI